MRATWLNRMFDRLPRLTIGPLPAFQACGLAGFLCAFALSFALAYRLHLDLWLVAAIAAGAIVTCLGVALGTKVATGEESLTYYHHHAAVAAVAAAVPYATGQPVLPYLDVAMLGLGTFLACGRVGCLLVGCCHGRPHHTGVRYPDMHADEGFPRSLVGVRLGPVQLIESVFVSAVVASGCALALNGAPAGTAFAWYVLAYSFGRFCIEFLRGDSVRRHFGRFSEPQWTSLLFTSLATFWTAWAWAPTLAILAMMAATTVIGRRREFAEMIDAADRAAREPHPQVARTAFGLRVSAGEAGGVRHYTLSADRPAVLGRWARSLAHARHPRRRWRVVDGSRPGILHVLVEE